MTPRQREREGEHGEPPQLTRVDERAQLERKLIELLPRVRRWLFRALGPNGPLDDAAQDALIELTRALPSFEGRSSLETFAHRITLRVAYRYYGRRQVTSSVFEPERIESAAPLPDAQLAARQALAKLHRCLAKLPEKRRTAFVLCGIEGLDAQEAAALIGTSVGSMRSRFMHARDELARLLGEQGGRS